MNKIISFVLLFLILGLLFPFQALQAHSMVSTVQGKFLIQNNDDLWYVPPGKQTRAFIADATVADRLIKTFGVHITKTQFNRLSQNATSTYVGKILILGTNHANAYYLYPTDKKMHFLGSGVSALTMMRTLASPISDANIKLIKINSNFPYIPPPTPPVVPPPVVEPPVVPPPIVEPPVVPPPVVEPPVTPPPVVEPPIVVPPVIEPPIVVPPVIEPPIVVPPVTPPPVVEPPVVVPPVTYSGLPASNPTQIITGPTGKDSVLYRSIANLNYAAFPQDPGNNYTITGKTIFVSKTGTYNGTGTITDPLNSIFKAEQLSTSGDMIVVRGGTYLDCIPQDYGCYELYLNKANVILRNYPGETVTLTPSGISRHGITIANDNITIDGINVANFNGTDIVLSWSATHSGTIIKNLTVSNSQDGIAAYGAQSGVLIKNVLVENNWLQGITCGTGPCTNWRFDRLIVKNQDLNSQSSGSDAIGIENGDNLLFTNLEVTGAGADGIDTKATRVAIFNANVHDVARNGIKLWQGGDIVNSTVSRTGADTSLSFATGGNYRILNSVVGLHNYDSQGTSYSVVVAYDHPTDAVNLEITNSVFYGNTGGMFLSPNTTLTLNNSLLQAGANNKVLEKGSLVIVGENNVSVLSQFGANNLPFSTNPMFLDPINHDYRVATGSPLIDAGKNSSLLPTFDITGNARLIGPNPDIGAFER